MDPCLLVSSCLNCWVLVTMYKCANSLHCLPSLATTVHYASLIPLMCSNQRRQELLPSPVIADSHRDVTAEVLCGSDDVTNVLQYFVFFASEPSAVLFPSPARTTRLIYRRPADVWCSYIACGIKGVRFLLATVSTVKISRPYRSTGQIRVFRSFKLMLLWKVRTFKEVAMDPSADFVTPEKIDSIKVNLAYVRVSLKQVVLIRSLKLGNVRVV